MSSTLSVDYINTQSVSTHSHTPGTITITKTTNMSIPSTASLHSVPSSSLTSSSTQMKPISINNTVLAVNISTVFILLVVTIIVLLLLVSVLVYKRQCLQLSSSSNSQLDTSSTEKETKQSNPTYQAQGISVSMQTCAEIRSIMNS